MTDRATIRLAPHVEHSPRTGDLSGRHTIIFPGGFDVQGRVRTVLPAGYVWSKSHAD